MTDEEKEADRERRANRPPRSDDDRGGRGGDRGGDRRGGTGGGDRGRGRR